MLIGLPKSRPIMDRNTTTTSPGTSQLSFQMPASSINPQNKPGNTQNIPHNVPSFVFNIYILMLFNFTPDKNNASTSTDKRKWRHEAQSATRNLLEFFDNVSEDEDDVDCKFY